MRERERERGRKKKTQQKQEGVQRMGFRKVPWAQKGVSNMVWQGHKSSGFTSGIIVPKKINENAEVAENIGNDLYQQMIYRIIGVFSAWEKNKCFKFVCSF